MTEQSIQPGVIILIGPPGSGKGTQADLLAEDFGLLHLESSKVIEDKFASADPNDADIANEKSLWAAGKLNTPEKVMQWMVERVRQLASEGKKLIFSGSPRTIPEIEAELPVFEELYGKGNIFVVNVDVPDEVSIYRNTRRRICQASRHPIPADYVGETCPQDGSPLMRRTNSKGESLDDPEKIPVRLQEYHNRTEPTMGYLKEHGYAILKVNGNQSIEKVHEDIVKEMHGLHTSMHTDILEKEKNDR